MPPALLGTRIWRMRAGSLAGAGSGACGGDWVLMHSLFTVVDFPLSLCPRSRTLIGGLRFFMAIFSALISESIWSLILRAFASACSLAQRSDGVSFGGGSRATARGSGVSSARVMASGGAGVRGAGGRRNRAAGGHFRRAGSGRVMGTAWEQQKLMMRANHRPCFAPSQSPAPGRMPPI